MSAVRTIVLVTLLVACGGGAKELLETAELEELQHNPTHARELYREILQKHPGTPQAATAAERLRALDAPK